MPPSIDLRSDYPLNLTLLGRAYSSGLKQCCRSRLTPARAIPPIGSGRFISRFLVDDAFDNQDYSRTIDRPNDPAEIGVYAGCCTHLCSSTCGRSASESAYGLTQVRLSDRKSQLHSDEHLTTSLERLCSSLHGNTEVNICELPGSSLSGESAACVVVGFHMVLRSGLHSPIKAFLCPVLKCGTRRKECISVLSPCVAPVRGHRSRSSQIRRYTSCLKAEGQ